ncbi:MAG: hypothetical protein ACREJX_03730, partial [Polyangiaceae bacterium]
MRWSRLAVSVFAVSCAAFGAFGIACGSSDDSVFNDGADGSSGDGSFNFDAAGQNETGFVNGGDGGHGGCVNLQCDQVTCDSGGTTTI